MSQQSVPETVRIDFRADARFDVVIHFDIAHMVFVYKSIDYFIGKSAYLRITEIQLESASIIYPFSMPYKEPIIRYLFSQTTTNPHYFDFQPNSWNHPFGTDIIHYLGKSSRKTFQADLPFPDTVPPKARRIPTGIDTVIFAPHFRCRID